MTDAADNGNGRVTLAEIRADIRHLTTIVEKMCAQCDDHEHRIRHGERWCDTSAERWRIHEREHTDLRTEVAARSRIEAIVYAAVGSIGSWLIPRP